MQATEFLLRIPVRGYRVGDGGGTPTPEPPDAPASLVASPVTPTRVDLSWTASAGATSYSVERSDDGGATWTVLAPSVAGTTYSDATVEADSTYRYRVSASNAAGTSGYSPAKTATTPDLATAPNAPSAPVASAQSTSSILFTWQDNSADETGFNVQRAPDSAGSPGTWADLATKAANATSHLDTGLTDSTRYHYRVRATNAAGDSAYTSPVSAVTPAESEGDNTLLTPADFTYEGVFNAPKGYGNEFLGLARRVLPDGTAVFYVVKKNVNPVRLVMFAEPSGGPKSIATAPFPTTLCTFDAINDGTAIGGLTHGSTYYLVRIDADHVGLSATNGGAAIDLTAIGVGHTHLIRSSVAGNSFYFYFDGSSTDDVDLAGNAIRSPAHGQASGLRVQYYANNIIAQTGGTVEFRGLHWDEATQRLYYNAGQFYSGSIANMAHWGYWTFDESNPDRSQWTIAAMHGPYGVPEAVNSEACKGVIQVVPRLREACGRGLYLFGRRGSTAQEQSFGPGGVAASEPVGDEPIRTQMPAQRIGHWDHKTFDTIAYSDFPRDQTYPAKTVQGNKFSGTKVTGTILAGSTASVLLLSQTLKGPTHLDNTVSNPVGYRLTFTVAGTRYIRYVRAWNATTKAATLGDENLDASPLPVTPSGGEAFDAHLPSYQDNIAWDGDNGVSWMIGTCVAATSSTIDLSLTEASATPSRATIQDLTGYTIRLAPPLSLADAADEVDYDWSDPYTITGYSTASGATGRATISGTWDATPTPNVTRFLVERTTTPGDVLVQQQDHFYGGHWIELDDGRWCVFFAGALAAGWTYYGHYDTHADDGPEGLIYKNRLESLLWPGQLAVDADGPGLNWGNRREQQPGYFFIIDPQVMLDAAAAGTISAPEAAYQGTMASLGGAGSDIPPVIFGDFGDMHFDPVNRRLHLACSGVNAGKPVIFCWQVG